MGAIYKQPPRDNENNEQYDQRKVF